MAKSSIVGDVINFRGFVYGPVNEMGVVGLFSKISEDLGFIIEEIRAAFPDCIARRKVDKGWERVGIEIEFKSSNFKLHGHDPAGCDLVVCWDHDWDTCPVPVLSLKRSLADAQANVSGPLSRVRIADPASIRLSTITAGGIKNGYINIKPLDDFWPSECIGSSGTVAGKHLIVEFQGIGRFTTDIFDSHKSLRSTQSAFKLFAKSTRSDQAMQSKSFGCRRMSIGSGQQSERYVIKSSGKARLSHSPNPFPVTSNLTDR